MKLVKLTDSQLRLIDWALTAYIEMLKVGIPHSLSKKYNIQKSVAAAKLRNKLMKLRNRAG